MPLDASIPLQVRGPQIAGPMDMMANALALQGGIHKNALARMQMQQLERATADETADREAIMSAGGDMQAAQNALMARGRVKPAMEISKSILDRRNTQSQIDEREAKVALQHLGVLSGVLAPLASKPNVTAEDVAAVLTTAQASGVPQEVIQRIASAVPQNAMQLSPFIRNVAMTTEHGRKSLEAMLPKVEMKETRGADGRPVLTPINTNPLGGALGPIAGAATAAVPFKLEQRDTGGSIQTIDPYTGTTTGQQIPKTMTPGDRISAGNLALSRERLNFDKEQPRGQYDADRGLLVDPRTGTATPVTQGGAPIGPKPEKLGEAAVKQLTGVKNLQGAITEYRAALKDFGLLDAMKPDERARMGTMYNNMLLQAKEAYNLGVLNGPDYKILQDVIADPSSIRGAVTSKKALDDQAAALDRVMTGIASTVAASSSRPGQAQAPRAESERKTVGGKSYVKMNGQWYEDRRQ